MSDLIGELKKITDDPFYNALNDDGYTSREELLEVVEKYGWHPASEPPEELVEVLVDIQEFENDNDKYTNIYIAVLHNGYWLLRTESEDAVVSAEGTYWMPLPEPYQEEASNG